MADWEGLHEDLLVLILKKIKLIEDFIAFGMVCKSWKEAVGNNKHCLRPQIPWLMLASSNNGDRQIYSFSKDYMLTKSLYVPPNRKCIGLNHGWILTISLTGEMNLINPLSRSEIQLPNQTSIPQEGYRTWPSTLFTRRAALSGNPSESSDFILMIVHSGGSFLGYWRPGDKSWTSTSGEEGGFYDLIYHNDQFYAISYSGLIWACTIHRDHPNNIVLTHITSIDRKQVFGADILVYIVESTSPDVLLLVVRSEDIGQEDFEEMEAVAEDEEGYKLYEDSNYRVIDFEVYEVDLINGSCSKPIKNLGDRTIFVGHRTSISFDTSQFIGTKPNQVYFTDDVEEWYPKLVNGGGKDMGFYSLEDAKIKQFSIGQSLSRISPPFWFIPSL